MGPWRVLGLVLAHCCAEPGPRATGYISRDLRFTVDPLWVDSWGLECLEALKSLASGFLESWSWC